MFELSVPKSANKYGQQFYTECVLYRDATSDIVFEAHFKDSKISSDVDARAQAIVAYNKELSEVLKNMPGGFSDALIYLMEWKEKTVETLAEACCLSSRTIQRMRTNDDYVSSIESVVAICIALKLPPVLSEELIRRSTCALGIGEKHLAYKFMLNSCYSWPIYECNEMLQKLGFEPLTKEQ